MLADGGSTAARGRPHDRRVELLLFLTLFVAYAYFGQAGGWNQNARFDQVRSIARDGTLHINDHWIYEPTSLDNGRIRIETALAPDIDDGVWDVDESNTLDISVYEGRIYPNKPPGTTLLALPGYMLVDGLGGLLVDGPETTWSLTLYHYLTTLLSVGLLGALGGIVLFRVSTRLYPNLDAQWHVGAALAFGLGTAMLPFSTLLFDHTPMAVLGLGCFALILQACDESKPSAWILLAAGAIAGFLIAINYTAVIIVGSLGLLLIARTRSPLAAMWFALGAVPPVLLLMAYHWVCFGAPHVIANAHQNPMFHTEQSVASSFRLPPLMVLRRLLFSQYRGFFITSPVLLLSLYGLWHLARRGGRQLEVAACGLIFGGYYLMNASFVDWHSGSSFAPRYMMPAIPFLSIGLAPALARLPRLGAALAVFSFAIVLMITAINPLIPSKEKHPLTGHILPLALGESQIIWDHVLLEAPVSVNPQGVYESKEYGVFDPSSEGARWNSFNLGELVLGRNLWSLLPLIGLIAAGTLAALRATDRSPPAGRRRAP